MVEFNYEVLDGQYAGAPIRYDYAVWNDDEDHFDLSVRRFNTIMIASGIPSGKAVDNLPQVASVMKNRKLAVSVDWEESQNGNWYLRESYQKLQKAVSQTARRGQNPAKISVRATLATAVINQLDIVNKPHRLKTTALTAKPTSMRLCLPMVNRNNHNSQTQMICRFN